MPLIGAHVDQANAIAVAQQLGVELIQVHVGDPQSWKKPQVRYPGGAEALGADAQAAGIDIYVHAPYVINVASTNNRIRIPSRKLLQQTVDEAAAMGAQGVIVHGGHVTGRDEPAQGYVNWRKAVDGLKLHVPILIENTAGGDRAMTRYPEAIEEVWQALRGSDNLEHVGVCLDTCHAFAAGLDMTTVVEDIRDITGRIDLVHLNDSRGEAGSGVDRHANLGEGLVDAEHLVGVVKAAGAPALLETPGAPEAHPADLAWIRERLDQDRL